MRTEPYYDHAKIKRVVVLRALPGLGDFLCAVPALRALRSALPRARITIVGLPHVRALADRFSYLVDEVLDFPGYPGIPERPFDPGAFVSFLAEANHRKFDLALQMHGSGITSNPFTVLLGAAHNAGFYLPGQYCPDFSTFLPYEEQESEVRRYTRLMDHLSFPSGNDELEFPLNDEDFARLSALHEASSLEPGGYVCIHPGAADPRRRWPPEDFAKVANRLAAEGLRIVITGTGQERELAASLARGVKGGAINLAGRTDLGALAALLSRARLLVCNDTGVSHLAAALRVPSVVVFTTTDPARWAPLDDRRHRVVLAQEGPERSLLHAQDLLNIPAYSGAWS